MNKILLFCVCVLLATSTVLATPKRETLQRIVNKMTNMQLHLPTLLEIQSRSLETTAADPAQPDPFIAMLNTFRNSIADQQKAADAQAANDTKTCEAKLKELGAQMASLNNTILKTNAKIVEKNKAIATMKDKVQTIVLKLDPKVKELQAIVVNIQSGVAARAQQAEVNEKKMNETNKMRGIISQLSKELGAQTQAKFRETLVQLQNQVQNDGLHRFLATSLRMLAPEATGVNASSINSENVAKLKQLLFLLDNEMKEYNDQINSTEKAAQTAWIQVLGTFQQQRVLIQKETVALVTQKQKLMDLIVKTQKERDTLKDNLQGLPEKLAVITPQFGTWTNQCGVKTQYYNAQTVSRRDQLSTIDAVLALSSSFQGSNVQTVLNKLAQQATAPAPAPAKATS